MTNRLLPCGPTAVVIEVDGIDRAVELAAWLRAENLPGVVDLVPAATTVLVQVDAPPVLALVEERVGQHQPVGLDAVLGELVEIPTVYDGEDVADVARQSGLTSVEVVELHSSTTYVAAFCGFVPGFAYLTGLDPRLQLPRRPSPRTRVPAGSVALATQFTAVYPRSSPGGWNLLGRTDAVMWDAARSRPALIEPGDRVHFVRVPK